jgi:WD40 repeat protein
MPQIDLANIKTRLVGCGAVMTVGQVIANVLSGSGPLADAAAAMIGGPIAVVGVSALATIAASLTGNLVANELGDKMVDRLAKNKHILDNHDLTRAAGEAIGYILNSVARSTELKELAKSKHLPDPKKALNELAEESITYWLNINTEVTDSSSVLKISEDQLTKIFSTDSFDEVTGLTVEDWGIFVNRFAASECKSFDREIVQLVAQKLHTIFPQAFREVLKQDAETGGQKFAAMVLNLHQIALAELKDLGLQNREILDKLEAVATQQQICQVMAKLASIEIGIRSDLGQIQDLLQRLVDTSAPRLPLPYECETIINDKVQDFTGRKFVFEAMSRFLLENPKGYFVLEADPGVGKSSIMAMCVLLLKRRCIVHFNSQSQGIVRPEQFLENVCTQLIKGFKLDYPKLPENATRDGNFLGRLLGEVSAKLNSKKLIFVVDALDEVDLSLQGIGNNVLYLPDSLPENVYFIVSKRPETLSLPNHQVFDLMQYNAESLEDVKAYIEKRTSNSLSIQDWINRQNLSREQFVAVVAEKSQNNFMYLRYVLNDIDSGKYSDVSLKDLPRELEGYYEKHWARMEMAVKDKELRRRKLKVIYLLTKTRKPVSCDILADFAEEDALDVQEVLDDWEHFLWRSSDTPPDYSIYHVSFKEFIHRLAQKLYQLLTDFDFIEAKLDALGVQPLIDDYDLAKDCNVLLSENQRETLQLIQGAIRKSAHVLDKDKTQRAGQLLGRLLDFYIPEIQGMLAQAKQSKNTPCLRPLKANLEPANEGALRTLAGHSGSVKAVAIAPDGKTVVSASWDNTLKIWDTETGRELKTLTGHSSLVNAVAITPDGKTAISASWDKTLKIWDTQTGRELKTLTGHSDWVGAVAIAPDSLTAISASWDKTLKIWDTKTGRELKTLTGHSESVTAVAIAPNGKTAISASKDETLKIWNTKTGRELKTLTGHSSGVTAVAIAPDGKRAISGSSDDTLKIWDTETGWELTTLISPTFGVSAVAITPDGKTVISSSSDSTLKIWDTDSGWELTTLTGHTGSVTAVAITPDGLTAISAAWDHTLKIWDTETGLKLKTLTGHSSGVNAVAIAPDGKRAISASDDKTLKIWDLLNGKEIASFSGDAEFNCCAILPDGVTVVAGDELGRVHFLRLEGMGDLGDV